MVRDYLRTIIQRMTAPFCAGLLVLVLTACRVHASFTDDMETLAMYLAQTLQCSPQTSLHMTTIPEDKSYMLSLMPVYKAIAEHLKPYVQEVRFHSFRGEENAILRSMILSGSREYAPMRLHERQVDSLILTGSYFLLDGCPDKINVVISVINLRAETIFQSNEYTISREDSSPALKRVVFSKLRNENAFAEVSYRGRIIKKLDNLFNSPNNNLLTYPAEYRFEQRHPYAMQWQIDVFKETVSLKYAISLSRSSSNTIIVEPTGTVVFVRDAWERQVDNCIDGEPLLPADFVEEYDSLYYLYTSNGNAPVSVEKKQYATDAEKKIRDRIYETFTTYYPKLFTPLNYKMLDKIFADKDHPSILVGAKMVSDPRVGREIVAYTWHTKKSWLEGLLTAKLQRRRTFAVNTEVMGVFNDNLDPNRYWAVILQKWKTKDRFGNVVYQDDGFLIVNFDFRSDQTLKEFKIHYRLWFYNYQYDDIELNIRRHEKLVTDLDCHFMRGLSGIDMDLKTAMRDFIISKVKGVKVTHELKESELHAEKK